MDPSDVAVLELEVAPCVANFASLFRAPNADAGPGPRVDLARPSCEKLR